jgi:hypothetical protein
MAEQKSNTLTIVLAILGILLLGCCGVGGYLGYQGWMKAKEVGTGIQAGLTQMGEGLKDMGALTTAETEFTSDLSAGDTEKAYNMTSKNFKTKYKTAKELKDYVEKNPDLKKGMTNPNIVVGTEGKPSTVTGLMGAKTVVLTFVKEDTLFKLDNIEIK